MWCTPVVIELQAAWLRRVPGTTKHCAEAPIGARHEGLFLRSVHFWTPAMNNFMELETASLRARLTQDPFYCRRCACGLCGRVCFPEDACYWTEWVKSGKGNYYHHLCKQRICGANVWLM